MEMPTVRRTAVLVIILASYFMIVLDISFVITALPKIHYSLGFSATELSWVQNAYTLTFGGLLLLGARAGDILGRRRMFVVGIALFTAASLAVGLAQSALWLIAARAVQGVGARHPIDDLSGRVRAHACGRLLRRRRWSRGQLRPRARRSSHKLDFLARRLLHQRADRHCHDARHPSLPGRNRAALGPVRPS